MEVVALTIVAQLAPDESHRSHWNAYFEALCQVPVFAVRVFGTTALPLIEGNVWALGAC